MIRIRVTIAAILLAVIATGTAGAAVLRLGNAFGNDGGLDAVLPMTLDSDTGEEVAALQCEVVFDTRVLTFVSVAAGPAATAAGKTVLSNVVRPGRVRCIVAGFNRTAVPDGQVFDVTLSVITGAADNAHFVDIENAILSDPNGRQVPVTAYYGAVLVGAVHMHAADLNEDWTITINELLRVIQFFNSSAYHCQAGTEDGYAVGSGQRDCQFHDSDFTAPRNWSISVAELLRLIQLFNKKAYHISPGSEDGFAPGIAVRETSAA